MATRILFFLALYSIVVTTHSSSNTYYPQPPPYHRPTQQQPQQSNDYFDDEYRADGNTDSYGNYPPSSRMNPKNSYKYEPQNPSSNRVYPPSSNRLNTPPPPHVPQPSFVPQHPQCTAVRRYPTTIPHGPLDNMKVAALNGVNVEECIDLCCSKGPKVCQYMWIFKKRCFSVACVVGRESFCEPRSAGSDGNGESSIYFKIAYSRSVLHRPGGTDSHIPGGVTMATDMPTMEGGNSEGGSPTDTTGQTGQTGSNSGENQSSTAATVDTTTHPTSPPSHATPPSVATETVSTATETPPPPTSGHDSSTISSAHPKETLTVAISGPQEITLPDNQVKLFASAWPDSTSLSYHWTRVLGKKEGTLSGMNDASVALSELVPGLYGLKVVVVSPSGDHGEAYVNVTVHSKPRDNTPPRPVIFPSKNYTVALPQETVIFDASQSTDDLGSENLSFLWEEVTGPVGTETISHEALLTLKNPKPGKYRYRLTITDSDGAHSSSYADLKVLPERDYRPTANAGSDLILKMPNSEVVLNGDGSSDDKPGMTYLWEYVSNQRGLDLEGSDSPELKVSKLSVGAYHFRLTVTDSSGQRDASEVTVDVLPEKNEPPLSVSGGPYTVHYPHTSALLDGSGSSDDYEKGMTYSWEQISGPNDIHLSGFNASQLNITGLHIDQTQGSPTTYSFSLTICDYANLTNTSVAVVRYYKDPKTLPHVSAGGNIIVTLPQNTAVLNGSSSADDFGIASYQWLRSDNSPAAGIPLLGSDTKPVLILSNLVNGTYYFTLTVTNTQGVSAKDNIILRVLANPFDRYIIQLHLDTDMSNFTRANMRDLGNYLSLTLDDYQIEFQAVYSDGPHTVVEFYALNTATHQVMNVTDAWKKLTENGQDYEILHYHVVQVEMKECQLSCSGHGKCDRRTKSCRCDIFWTENPFMARTGRQESNCEWSVFYVVLAVLAALVVVGVAIWLTCCCCLRKSRLSRSKRRIRYAIHDNGDAAETKSMLSQECIGPRRSGLMVSESETEEEILFDSAKKGRTSPVVKNNRLNSEKYGKNSSLVNTVIPK